MLLHCVRYEIDDDEKAKRVKSLYGSAGAYLVTVLTPWILKTVLYSIAFRKRNIKATFLTILTVAGAPMLVGALFMVLPIHLGSFGSFVFTVGAAIYLCKQYTNGELYPDIIAVVSIIEILAALTMAYIVTPMIN
jgi:hypothetical protein